MPTKSQLMERLADAEAEIARLRAAESPRVIMPSVAASRIFDACQDEQETFVVLMLDARQKILRTMTVALGSLAEVQVHPREVFRGAVRIAAHSIIVGHNHPSGDSEPSDADLVLTSRLCEAGQVLGIPVLDHIIVSRTGSVSLASRGLMGT